MDYNCFSVEVRNQFLLNEVWNDLLTQNYAIYFSILKQQRLQIAGAYYIFLISSPVTWTVWFRNLKSKKPVDHKAIFSYHFLTILTGKTVFYSIQNDLPIISDLLNNHLWNSLASYWMKTCHERNIWNWRKIRLLRI